MAGPFHLDPPVKLSQIFADLGLELSEIDAKRIDSIREVREPEPRLQRTPTTAYFFDVGDEPANE